MLYDINGNPLTQTGAGYITPPNVPDAQTDAATQKVFRMQLMNMMLFQRERLLNIVDQCNSALEKIDAPEHSLVVRLLQQIRDKSLDTINEESVAGYVSGMQTRMAYEICEKLVEEAKLFDGEDGNDCQELMRTLIALTLKKLEGEESTAGAA